MIVSTSSESFDRVLISPRRPPDATVSLYSRAKLLRPIIAARRSSRSVLVDRRRHSVWMVDVASCFGGAWAWRMPRSDIEGVGIITVWLGGELLVFCGVVEYLELMFSLAGQGERNAR